MARTSISSPALSAPPLSAAGASSADSAYRCADSTRSSLSTLAMRRSVSGDGWTSRPCSSQVYQLTLTPASTATSSRRKPGVRRGPSGRPKSLGSRRARRLERKAPNSWRCSAEGLFAMGCFFLGSGGCRLFHDVTPARGERGRAAALTVAHADLGERLILRSVLLLEQNSGVAQRTGDRLRYLPGVPVHRRLSQHGLAQRFRDHRRPARIYPHRRRRVAAAVVAQIHAFLASQAVRPVGT